MDNFFSGNADIQWHFNHLDLQEVVGSLEDDYKQSEQFEDAPLSYEDAVEGFRTVLDMAGAITASEIAPLAPEVDREGAHFDHGTVTYAKGTAQAMDTLAEAGLMGVMLPRQYGGLNFPGWSTASRSRWSRRPMPP